MPKSDFNYFPCGHSISKDLDKFWQASRRRLINQCTKNYHHLLLRTICCADVCGIVEIIF